MDGRIKATEASIYDTFKWLEDDDGLDLSLDDYHYNLRQDVENQRKSRSSSIRRHLSISSKMTFRPSSSLSRPGTQDGNNSMHLSNKSVISLQHPSGHIRRRSRALSLISPSASKQQMPGDSPTSPALDPASHYQDPETRLKLRAYLSSPHKFDEALEFGFPAVDQAQGTGEQLPKRTDSLVQPSDNGLHRMQTLPEDRRCSVYSDGTTTADPDSPRTPDTLEKPALHSERPSQEQQEQEEQQQQEQSTATQGDYAQAPASSREMTLRMTLTRPDLRANDDQIYGWQKQRPSNLDSPRSPAKTSTDDDFKSNIEKQLAAIDQENMAANENSSVKRLWNRMRRN